MLARPMRPHALLMRGFSTISRAAAAPPPGARAGRRPPVEALAGEERGRALRAGAGAPVLGPRAAHRTGARVPAPPVLLGDGLAVVGVRRLAGEFVEVQTDLGMPGEAGDQLKLAAHGLDVGP